jgi:hypothetical protein
LFQRWQTLEEIGEFASICCLQSVKHFSQMKLEIPARYVSRPLIPQNAQF